MARVPGYVAWRAWDAGVLLHTSTTLICCWALLESFVVSYQGSWAEGNHSSKLDQGPCEILRSNLDLAINLQVAPSCHGSEKKNAIPMVAGGNLAHFGTQAHGESWGRQCRISSIQSGVYAVLRNKNPWTSTEQSQVGA